MTKSQVAHAHTNSGRQSSQPRRQRRLRDALPAETDAKNPREEQEKLERGAYHRHICELEWTVSTLRERVGALEAALADANSTGEQLADLFKHAPIGYVVHDRAGNLTTVNAAAAVLLQISPGDRLSRSLAQFLPRTELSLWLEHIRSALLTSHARTEFNLHGRAGQVTPVQLATRAVPRALNRAANEFRSTLTDLSTLRAAERALAQTQRDYHQLIDSVEGIVWEAETGTLRVTFVSRYAEKLLGYPLTEWARPGFWLNRIHYEDRERVSNELARITAQCGQARLEYRVLTAKRQVIWLHDTISFIERAGERHLLGVAMDVTERRKAEQDVCEARDSLEQRVEERTASLRETVAELEAFSYSLSHDLRSPIRAMQGFATLLQRSAGGKLSPQEQEYLHRIKESSERLDLLVKDVLQYSRIARGPVQMGTISLDRLVHNILHDYADLAPAKAQIDVQEHLLPVLGHEAFVGQAMSNLLTNAVKFVPAGKKPRVRVWTEPAGTGAPETGKPPDPKDRWVRIWVEDNGLGVAPQDQKRIFKIFERVHPHECYQGTGIGLAIVQKAVERMGGRLGLQSQPGQGSKFWIELRQAEG